MVLSNNNKQNNQNKIIFKNIKIHVHVQLPKNVAEKLLIKIEYHNQTRKIRNDKIDTYLEKTNTQNTLYSSSTNKTKKSIL